MINKRKILKSLLLSASALAIVGSNVSNISAANILQVRANGVATGAAAAGEAVAGDIGGLVYKLNRAVAADVFQQAAHGASAANTWWQFDRATAGANSIQGVLDATSVFTTTGNAAAAMPVEIADNDIAANTIQIQYSNNGAVLNAATFTFNHAQNILENNVGARLIANANRAQWRGAGVPAAGEVFSTAMTALVDGDGGAAGVRNNVKDFLIHLNPKLKRVDVITNNQAEYANANTLAFGAVAPNDPGGNTIRVANIIRIDQIGRATISADNKGAVSNRTALDQDDFFKVQFGRDGQHLILGSSNYLAEGDRIANNASLSGAGHLVLTGDFVQNVTTIGNTANGANQTFNFLSGNTYNFASDNIGTKVDSRINVAGNNTTINLRNIEANAEAVAKYNAINFYGGSNLAVNANERAAEHLKVNYNIGNDALRSQFITAAGANNVNNYAAITLKANRQNLHFNINSAENVNINNNNAKIDLGVAAGAGGTLFKLDLTRNADGADPVADNQGKNAQVVQDAVIHITTSGNVKDNPEKLTITSENITTGYTMANYDANNNTKRASGSIKEYIVEIGKDNIKHAPTIEVRNHNNEVVAVAGGEAGVPGAISWANYRGVANVANEAANTAYHAIKEVKIKSGTFSTYHTPDVADNNSNLRGLVPVVAFTGAEADAPVYRIQADVIGNVAANRIFNTRVLVSTAANANNSVNMKFTTNTNNVGTIEIATFVGDLNTGADHGKMTTTFAAGTKIGEANNRLDSIKFINFSDAGVINDNIANVSADAVFETDNANAIFNIYSNITANKNIRDNEEYKVSITATVDNTKAYGSTVKFDPNSDNGNNVASVGIYNIYGDVNKILQIKSQGVLNANATNQRIAKVVQMLATLHDNGNYEYGNNLKLGLQAQTPEANKVTLNSYSIDFSNGSTFESNANNVILGGGIKVAGNSKVIIAPSDKSTAVREVKVYSMIEGDAQNHLFRLEALGQGNQGQSAGKSNLIKVDAGNNVMTLDSISKHNDQKNASLVSSNDKSAKLLLSASHYAAGNINIVNADAVNGGKPIALLEFTSEGTDGNNLKSEFNSFNNTSLDIRFKNKATKQHILNFANASTIDQNSDLFLSNFKLTGAAINGADGEQKGILIIGDDVNIENAINHRVAIVAINEKNNSSVTLASSDVANNIHDVVLIGHKKLAEGSNAVQKFTSLKINGTAQNNENIRLNLALLGDNNTVEFNALRENGDNVIKVSTVVKSFDLKNDTTTRAASSIKTLLKSTGNDILENAIVTVTPVQNNANNYVATINLGTVTVTNNEIKTEMSKLANNLGIFNKNVTYKFVSGNNAEINEAKIETIALDGKTDNVTAIIHGNSNASDIATIRIQKDNQTKFISAFDNIKISQYKVANNALTDSTYTIDVNGTIDVNTFVDTAFSSNEEGKNIFVINFANLNTKSIKNFGEVKFNKSNESDGLNFADHIETNVKTTLADNVEIDVNVIEDSKNDKTRIITLGKDSVITLTGNKTYKVKNLNFVASEKDNGTVHINNLNLESVSFGKKDSNLKEIILANLVHNVKDSNIYANDISYNSSAIKLNGDYTYNNAIKAQNFVVFASSADKGSKHKLNFASGLTSPEGTAIIFSNNLDIKADKNNIQGNSIVIGNATNISNLTPDSLLKIVNNGSVDANNMSTYTTGNTNSRSLILGNNSAVKLNLSDTSGSNITSVSLFLLGNNHIVELDAVSTNSNAKSKNLLETNVITIPSILSNDDSTKNRIGSNILAAAGNNIDMNLLASTGTLNVENSEYTIRLNKLSKDLTNEEKKNLETVLSTAKNSLQIFDKKVKYSIVDSDNKSTGISVDVEPMLVDSKNIKNTLIVSGSSDSENFTQKVFNNIVISQNNTTDSEHTITKNDNEFKVAYESKQEGKNILNINIGNANIETISKFGTVNYNADQKENKLSYGKHIAGGRINNLSTGVNLIVDLVDAKSTAQVTVNMAEGSSFELKSTAKDFASALEIFNLKFAADKTNNGTVKLTGVKISDTIFGNSDKNLASVELTKVNHEINSTSKIYAEELIYSESNVSVVGSNVNFVGKTSFNNNSKLSLSGTVKFNQSSEINSGSTIKFTSANSKLDFASNVKFAKDTELLFETNQLNKGSVIATFANAPEAKNAIDNIKVNSNSITQNLGLVVDNNTIKIDITIKSKEEQNKKAIEIIKANNTLSEIKFDINSNNNSQYISIIDQAVSAHGNDLSKDISKAVANVIEDLRDQGAKINSILGGIASNNIGDSSVDFTPDNLTEGISTAFDSVNDSNNLAMNKIEDEENKFISSSSDLNSEVKVFAGGFVGIGKSSIDAYKINNKEIEDKVTNTAYYGGIVAGVAANNFSGSIFFNYASISNSNFDSSSNSEDKLKNTVATFGGVLKINANDKASMKFGGSYSFFNLSKPSLILNTDTKNPAEIVTTADIQTIKLDTPGDLNIFGGFKYKFMENVTFVVDGTYAFDNKFKYSKKEASSQAAETTYNYSLEDRFSLGAGVQYIFAVNNNLSIDVYGGGKFINGKKIETIEGNTAKPVVYEAVDSIHGVGKLGIKYKVDNMSFGINAYGSIASKVKSGGVSVSLDFSN